MKLTQTCPDCGAKWPGDAKQCLYCKAALSDGQASSKNNKRSASATDDAPPEEIDPEIQEHIRSFRLQEKRFTVKGTKKRKGKPTSRTALFDLSKSAVFFSLALLVGGILLLVFGIASGDKAMSWIGGVLLFFSPAPLLPSRKFWRLFTSGYDPAAQNTPERTVIKFFNAVGNPSLDYRFALQCLTPMALMKMKLWPPDLSQSQRGFERWCEYELGPVWESGEGVCRDVVNLKYLTADVCLASFKWGASG